jgi:cation diffusion facilitator family transporter
MAGTPQTDNKEVRRVTYIGMIVNALLAAVKIVVGSFSHSSAVVADGVHSLSDMFTDAAVIAGSHFWARPADEGHPHGHRQIENAVTLIIGLTLAAVAVTMTWHALSSIHLREQHSPGIPALVVALLSIAIKEALFRWTSKKGHAMHCEPLVANAWHHRSDAFSSIPAAAAVGLAALGPEWSFIDHVGAIAVAIIVMHAAFKIAWPAFQKLVDSGGPKETVDAISKTARSTPGVRDVHIVRTRYIGGSRLAVDLHVLVDGALSVSDGHNIASAVRDQLIAEHPDIVDVIVHTEPFHSQRAPQ